MPVSIPFREPASGRYIYVNTATNKVHLLVPFVGGAEISTDNTCAAMQSFKYFFQRGDALSKLETYKEALIFDIALLEATDQRRVDKEERLAQIDTYIKEVLAMKDSSEETMMAVFDKPSNLYGIQLRPLVQDKFSRNVNPIFSVNRENDQTGNPISALYNAMQRIFPGTKVAATDPKSRLTTAVLNAIPVSASFSDIQQALAEQSLTLFGVSLNFTEYPDGTPATQEAIDSALLSTGANDVSRNDYIEALLGACIRDISITLPTQPFYRIQAVQKTEHLSILTQFFLAHVNMYCKANGISNKNFGVILDGSTALSDNLVSQISAALTGGEDVERTICTFCNDNANQFHLSRIISEEDLTAIRETFERNYRAIAESPHMDDFMLLDKQASGETAKFVIHQGSISINLAELTDLIAVSSNPEYFASIRADFATHPAEIPNNNQLEAGEAEVSVETLIARLNDKQLERLPTAVKEACLQHPAFNARQFLNHVARGEQTEAEVLLTQPATPFHKQLLLREPNFFTDYSGRAFKCTAYEYAYWAKDTHMCRMLETHMDEETKALMLAQIDANDASGLSFEHNGEYKCCPHFDLTPLKSTLQTYLDNYKNYVSTKDYVSKNQWSLLDKAWERVGKEQFQLPAHMAQEYCSKGFSPKSKFNESTLPRNLNVLDFNNAQKKPWFSMSGPEFNLGIVSSIYPRGISRPFGTDSQRAINNNLQAITHLDAVRTADLELSRENLNRPASLYEGY